MSSVRIHTCECLSRTSEMARRSSFEYTAPDGFDGEFRINHLVRGVNACSSASGRIRNPFSMFVSIKTGVAPQNRVSSGYDTQYGEGMTTSSPGPSVASNAFEITCLPPLETIVSLGA